MLLILSRWLDERWIMGKLNKLRQINVEIFAKTGSSQANKMAS